MTRSLVLAALALPAVVAPAAEPAEPHGLLRAASTAAVPKPATSVYIVTLKQAAAATYEGGIPGLAATRPARGEKLDRNAGHVASYVQHLEQIHADLLASVGARDAKLYSLRYALNGFAARLTAAQATALAHHERVERVWLDTDHKTETNNSSVFLGLLDPDGGLRADIGLTGEGVVVGVIDSGLAPKHPSLLDAEPQIPRVCTGGWAEQSWLGRWLCGAVRRNPPTEDLYDPLAGFSGVCQEGEGFAATDCNDKVVGARYYLDGFTSRHTLDDGEFISPKDADGHGTHIATTIAGQSVSASLFGTRVARIGGIAPRARIAVYKACWLKPGELRATCTTADLARAIDDAVADGVDIINYSVGTSQEDDLAAPDDLALLNAFDAGVLSIVAAGNDGPTLRTIGSPASAPWVLTVAASTQSGTAFEEAVEITAPTAIAGLIAMREASFTPPLALQGAITADVVLADDAQTIVMSGVPGSTRDACDALVNDADVGGRIVLIERGNCDFDVKLAHAGEAGAVGAIVYNTVGAPFIMNGDGEGIDIAAIMIGAADGQRLVDRLLNDEIVTVTLTRGEFLNRSQTGDQMASFSSRGPAISEADFLKPDVTAPGVDILAGHTPDAANSLKGQSFQYLSGTSMSVPETAGVAALLKEAHPDWSPAALKSALMTSAYQALVGNDGSTEAHPFERGAGHIDANAGLDPGLVFESSIFDYAAYLCGTETPPFPETDCAILELSGFSFAPREVNVPSFGVSELIRGDSVTRRVTNIGAPATYRATITQPIGIGVSVEPKTLTLGTGQAADFRLVFDTDAQDYDLWTFGEIEWADGVHSVKSPLALKPVQLRIPHEISLLGTVGDGTYETDFGYSGVYDISVHGLNPPFYVDENAFIDDDPSNTFSFRDGDGVAQHRLTIAPGDLYLRIATFDAMTDGEDDLDLYLFYCGVGDSCTQIAQSGTFTSEEQIDVAFPTPGEYAVLVHGFETDQIAGGPGANYAIYAWTFSETDGRDNLTVTIPTSVVEGDRYDITIDWSDLDPAVRYFGGILHYTPGSSSQPYGLTRVTAVSP